MEWEIDTVATGSGRLEESGRRIDSGGTQATMASFLARRALGPQGWYFAGGLRAENYLFSNGPGWPRRLQDYAAIGAIEYFEGDETAASLTLRPGWYFEGRATAAAWDVPVDLVVSLPVTRALSGVVGLSNARFFHHALPVAGFVWNAGTRARLEAVFPEPAVEFTLDRRWSLRIGGELGGGGFRSDARGGSTPVEYVSYRVGAELHGLWQPGVKLSLTAGVETERSFDFFRRQQRAHGGGAAYLKLSVTFLP